MTMSIYGNRPSRLWRVFAFAVAATTIGLCGAGLAYAGQAGDLLRARMVQGVTGGFARVAADNADRAAPNVAPGEAARRAASKYGGRVLNVVLEHGPGGPYYRVKLLDGGRVRVVHVQARQ